MNETDKTGSGHPYGGIRAALATIHGKEQAISPPFHEILGASIEVPEGINTDLLGTFSGEIERKKTPLDTARDKARMGMKQLGLPFGIASEGSFGPHVYFPFISQDHEMLIWIDDERGFELVEHKISTETNFNSKTVSHWSELGDFLVKAQFPSHALVIRPNSGFIEGLTFKGLKKESEVKEAIECCSKESKDGKAHVETDMRAHMNPTRMKVINEAAASLAKRLECLCPKCSCPGWGMVDVVRGLPCEDCGEETELVKEEVYGCPLCEEKRAIPRKDGVTKASPGQCPFCNP
jgi:hypothetical protein